MKNWNEKHGHLYIGYKQNLKDLDIPKSFTIYFTTRNDWHGIVMDTWAGKIMLETELKRAGSSLSQFRGNSLKKILEIKLKLKKLRKKQR